jgi:hypothetical protein
MVEDPLDLDLVRELLERAVVLLRGLILGVHDELLDGILDA